MAKKKEKTNQQKRILVIFLGGTEVLVNQKQKITEKNNKKDSV